jgi:hypothetical protein
MGFQDQGLSLSKGMLFFFLQVLRVFNFKEHRLSSVTKFTHRHTTRISFVMYKMWTLIIVSSLILRWIKEFRRKPEKDFSERKHRFAVYRKS